MEFTETIQYNMLVSHMVEDEAFYREYKEDYPGCVTEAAHLIMGHHACMMELWLKNTKLTEQDIAIVAQHMSHLTDIITNQNKEQINEH